MYILGINAYHADSAACLIKDGKLVAAIEEERIRRVKHWAGFPSEAIKFCLGYAGIGIQDIDHIAISRDPKANYWKKVWFVFKARPNLKSLINRLRNKSRVKSVLQELMTSLGVSPYKVRAKFHNVEHHRAHLASAFFVSPFRDAALLSIDGMGDFTSTMWGVGNGNKVKVLGEINYPDSIGFFYTAITQFLGFWKFGDEYKIMGLAAFGEPNYLKELREIVKIRKDGLFELNQDYFLHVKGEVNMAWEGGYPELGKLYSNKLEELLGTARKENEELTQKHKDIAASAQAMYEEVFFSLLDKLSKDTGKDALCFAGGTAQNSLANGKIFNNSDFKEVFIQPAGYDAGGALGAAFYVWHQILGNPRNLKTSDDPGGRISQILGVHSAEIRPPQIGSEPFVMAHSYWGPEYHNDEIETILKKNNLAYKFLEDDELFKETARHLADGKVVGWFQGRTEWGPRALGNRSILANPARPDMKDILNLKIKKRESFRPFAPSILEEYVGEYFVDPRDASGELVSQKSDVPNMDVPNASGHRTSKNWDRANFPAVPFMEKVYVIKPEMRAKIPAVTHADGTGRLQTVSQKTNPVYWHLIDAFRQITGVPILLNTSFNENEPIVNKPQEAIDCFLRTKMDVLVIGNFIVERVSS